MIFHRGNFILQISAFSAGIFDLSGLIFIQKYREYYGVFEGR